MAIYNLKVQKLARTIRSDQSVADASLVADFGMSGGLNKLLFVIWGEVDPVLIVYRWYNGKVIASVRDSGVIRAAFEPATDMLLAISDRTIMVFSLVQGSLQKSASIDTVDVRPLFSICAIRSHRIVADRSTRHDIATRCSVM